MAIGLVSRRFERLEKAQTETNRRLARLEEATGRVAGILEVHSDHFERIERALIGISDRVDRMTAAIVRARTGDLRQMDDLDRRLRKLERRSKRSRIRPGERDRRGR